MEKWHEAAKDLKTACELDKKIAKFMANELVAIEKKCKDYTSVCHVRMYSAYRKVVVSDKMFYVCVCLNVGGSAAEVFEKEKAEMMTKLKDFGSWALGE